MDRALIELTDEIISGIDLSLMEEDDVPTFKYTCPECGIELRPASFRETNKRIPYFKQASHDKPHDPECLYDDKSIKSKKRSKEKYNSVESFPDRFPSTLVLRDSRPSKIGITPDLTNDSGPRAPSTPVPARKKNFTASSIYLICATYIRYEYCRNILPLRIKSINGNTYYECFRRVQFNCPGQENSILFGLMEWASLKELSPQNNSFVINILAWDSLLNKPGKVSLIIDCSTWTQLMKNSFIAEFLEIAKNAQKDNNNARELGVKSMKMSMIYFISSQDKINPNIFRLNHRKLVCGMFQDK